MTSEDRPSAGPTGGKDTHVSDQDFFFDEDGPSEGSKPAAKGQAPAKAQAPAKTSAKAPSPQAAPAAPASAASSMFDQSVTMTVAALLMVIALLVGVILGFFLGQSMAIPPATALNQGLPAGHVPVSGAATGTPTP
jgi:hypothetical protein